MSFLNRLFHYFQSVKDKIEIAKEEHVEVLEITPTAEKTVEQRDITIRGIEMVIFLYNYFSFYNNFSFW